ncbi:MAG: hypothetical protein KF823_07655 [Xanthomonadales bacterium]|nr:hypothetical protein [Xanthomonadales bacterium]
MSRNELLGIRRSGFAAVAVLVLLLLAPAIALATPVKPGHAGHWSAPERDGEGWVLELLDADSALLYWFTYDEAGNQRWLTAVGELRSDAAGEYLAFPELVATRGARFGAAFDPGDVVREVVGSSRLRFEDCERAVFGFQAYGQVLTIPLQRLAHLMGSACERPHGTTGRPSAAHAGLSGSWYDPSRSGEGYALQWINPEQAILTWYTYDTAGRQYWLIGEGRFDGEGRIVAQVHSTRGGRFGAAFDPGQVERVDWGEVVLSIGCAGGPGDYASTVPGFGQGRQQLQRLTALHRLGCPWQAPRLTDLYDVEFVELPSGLVEPDLNVGLADPVYLDDSGALWARGGWAPVFGGAWAVGLAPGDSVWRRLGTIVDVRSLFVADGGGIVLATHVPERFAPYQRGRWDGQEWQTQTEPELGPFDFINAVSADGRGFLLTPSRQSPNDPWRRVRWQATTGFEDISFGPYTSPTPTLLGNASGPMVGRVAALPGSGAADQMAVIWVDPRQPPQRPPGPPMNLEDPASPRWILVAPSVCSADCGIVFGDAAVAGDDASRFRAEPWYLLVEGRSAFLGQVNAGVETRYTIRGSAQDGSLVAGRIAQPSASAFSTTTTDGFVWTPLTGISALSTVLQDAGMPVDEWAWAEVRSVSPNGLRMLMYVRTDGSGFARGMLTLVPRME